MSQWLTDEKEEIVECFYGAREREEGHGMGELECTAVLECVYSWSGATSISPANRSSEETSWKCALRGVFDVAAT